MHMRTMHYHSYATETMHMASREYGCWVLYTCRLVCYRMRQQDMYIKDNE